MKLKFAPYLLILFIVASSCISRPDYVLDEEAMVSLLTDVHRSEGLLELQQNNNLSEDFKQSIMAAVLVKHNVSRAQYDSSLVWYGQNLKHLVKVYSKVQKNINDDIEYWTTVDDESKLEFAISEAGDSVQIWTVDNFMVLDESKLLSFRFWEIPSDSNYVAGDSIIWHLNIPQVPQSHFIVASLSLNYDKDENSSSINNTVVVRRDSSFDITCVSCDTTVIFNSIIASISLLKDSVAVKDDYAFVDSLSLIRIHR